MATWGFAHGLSGSRAYLLSMMLCCLFRALLFKEDLENSSPDSRGNLLWEKLLASAPYPGGDATASSCCLNVAPVQRAWSMAEGLSSDHLGIVNYLGRGQLL